MIGRPALARRYAVDDVLRTRLPRGTWDLVYDSGTLDRCRRRPRRRRRRALPRLSTGFDAARSRGSNG